MGKTDILSAANAFIQADIDYVKLIHQALDFKHKGTNHVSPQEMRAILEAKAKKATLEEQMFKVWELHDNQY